MKEIKTIKILGVPINKISKKQFLQKVKTIISKKQKLQIATVNAEFLVDAQKNKDFHKILNFSFNIADSASILWAAFYLKSIKQFPKNLRFLIRILFFLPSLILTPFSSLFFKEIPTRLPGADIFWDLIKLADKKGWRIYLLGAQEGVAQKTRRVILKRYPRAQIVGAETGDNIETNKLVDKINNTQTNILFVAYGAPKQEKWINANMGKLNSGTVAIGVGGTFDFVSGLVERAPKWMRNLGLEWFFRLMKNPKKRLPRILKAIFVFPWLVLAK